MKRIIWLKITIVLQLLTAGIHSLSFFSDPVAKNETESQLIDLISNYHNDLGAGFTPTFSDLFTALSACFSLLCLFGGLLNMYLLRKNIPAETMKGAA